MRERPILFSAPMVRAILEGRKTQTRRVVQVHGEGLHNGKKLNEWDLSSGPFQLTEEDFPVWRWQGNKPAKVRDWAQYIQTDVDDNVTFPISNPYGVPGDRLWVKEATWIWCRKVPDGLTKTGRPKFRYYPHGRNVVYCADHPQKPERESYAEPNMVWKYKTARFMPRWASRITLELTDVRVQRVQEISEEDAKAEGVYIGSLGPEATDGYYGPRNAFKHLWDSINAKRGYGWGANPWVWALTFRRLP